MNTPSRSSVALSVAAAGLLGSCDIDMPDWWDKPLPVDAMSSATFAYLRDCSPDRLAAPDLCEGIEEICDGVHTVYFDESRLCGLTDPPTPTGIVLYNLLEGPSQEPSLCLDFVRACARDDSQIVVSECFANPDTDAYQHFEWFHQFGQEEFPHSTYTVFLGSSIDVDLRTIGLTPGL